MPFDEYRKWEEHIKYYPPSGLYEQHLLATLICLQINSKEKKYNVYEIAPWLRNPKVDELLNKKADAHDALEASSIYEQMKKERMVQNGSSD